MCIRDRRLALVCHILLVGFDHLLERVSRTTFELFQIPHRAFAGEKFDLQLNFIIIDRYKDAVDIFLHKIAVDESVHRIVAGGLQHAADLRDVRVQVGAGVLLLLKLSETAAALLNLLVALTVHLEKICVRDLSGDIILEQLADVYKRQGGGIVVKLCIKQKVFSWVDRFTVFDETGADKYLSLIHIWTASDRGGTAQRLR